MLSYMLPVEEKPQNSRNMILNLNLRNTSLNLNDQQELDEISDENTKLLDVERIHNAPSMMNENHISNACNKIKYNINITNNNLCNSFVDNSNATPSAPTNATSLMEENDIAVTDENSVNNNDEKSVTSDKKIVKMTKLGSKNVTLKR